MSHPSKQGQDQQNQQDPQAETADASPDASPAPASPQDDAVQGGTGEAAGLPAGADASVLDDVGAFISRYVVLSAPEQLVALVLFVAHTYAIAAAQATPYLAILSPQKRSGKSRLLEVLEQVVARPWRVAGASEAALFRKIDAHQPTLLLDEVDAIFAGQAERTEPLRAVLNAGNRRGAMVVRCVRVGGNHDVEDFAVFGAKVLAGIDTGRLPDTIADRAVIIRLARRRPDEQVAPFRFAKAVREAEQLRERLEAWLSPRIDELAEAEPDLPAQLNDRAWEAWEPLMAVAELAGDDWAERAGRAAVALAREVEVDDDTPSVQLLADIRTVIAGEDAIASRDLVFRLAKIEDAPWGQYGGSRRDPGLTQRELARLLRPFKIAPKGIRIQGAGTAASTTAKGYRARQFADAFARYLPPAGPDAGEAPGS